MIEADSVEHSAQLPLGNGSRSRVGKLAESSDANAGPRAFCPNFQPKNDGPKVRTRFPQSGSSQKNRLFFKRKGAIQVFICGEAQSASGAL